MKTKLLLTAFVSSFILHTSAFAQGALTPPGAPAPTMKSLDQVEARTIVNAANTPGNAGNLYIISQPGSYYLTTNLTGVNGKHGISVTANNVTLDLNGFAVQGVGANTIGITIPNAQTNVTVQNGSVSGWAYDGADALSSGANNILFEHLNVFANGGVGIYLFGNGVVRNCNSHKNNSDGIYSNGGSITGCAANNNGGTGITIYSGVIADCTARKNSLHGIYVAPGSVSGCLVSGNTSAGIDVDGPGSMVSRNTCIGNGYGIFVNDARNRIEDNQVTASITAGIQIANTTSYTNNLVIKNSVFGNGANNYVTPNTQIVGPIITATGTITSVNPWANFSY